MATTTIPIKGFDNVDYTLTLTHPTISESGEIEIARNGVSLERAGGTVDQPIETMKLKLQMIATADGQWSQFAHVEELSCSAQLVRDSDSAILFKGYLSPEGYSEPLKPYPYNVSLVLTCGMNLLKRKNYEPYDPVFAEPPFNVGFKKIGAIIKDCIKHVYPSSDFYLNSGLYRPSVKNTPEANPVTGKIFQEFIFNDSALIKLETDLSEGETEYSYVNCYDFVEWVCNDYGLRFKQINGNPVFVDYSPETNASRLLGRYSATTGEWLDTGTYSWFIMDEVDLNPVKVLPSSSFTTKVAPKLHSCRHARDVESEVISLQRFRDYEDDKDSDGYLPLTTWSGSQTAHGNVDNRHVINDISYYYAQSYPFIIDKRIDSTVYGSAYSVTPIVNQGWLPITPLSLVYLDSDRYEAWPQASSGDPIALATYTVGFNFQSDWGTSLPSESTGDAIVIPLVFKASASKTGTLSFPIEAIANQYGGNEFDRSQILAVEDTSFGQPDPDFQYRCVWLLRKFTAGENDQYTWNGSGEISFETRFGGGRPQANGYPPFAYWQIYVGQPFRYAINQDNHTRLSGGLSCALTNFDVSIESSDSAKANIDIKGLDDTIEWYHQKNDGTLKLYRGKMDQESLKNVYLGDKGDYETNSALRKELTESKIFYKQGASVATHTSYLDIDELFISMQFAINDDKNTTANLVIPWDNCGGNISRDVSHRRYSLDATEQNQSFITSGSKWNITSGQLTLNLVSVNFELENVES